MKRAAVYARYSSDNQRAASIADQLRLCHHYAEAKGWTVVEDFRDEAQSGASLMRPSLQAMMRAATLGAFDVVLTESLDRLSRDQEDTAGIFKRLKFVGIGINTVSEGDINNLHIGLKGTMNQLYLDELAAKTRRGLEGRVLAGKSGGGRCYGYRVAPSTEPDGRGDRVIEAGEAAVIRRVFREYAEGRSPEAIAKSLNAEGIPGPRPRDTARPAAWSPSTIYGHARRGTGLLNNELYVGRLIWNRLRYVKDPETGRRVSRPNPINQLTVVDVPHLRIIDEPVWLAVKARQSATRQVISRGIVDARRPKYLFSGLTVCETCGGGFTISSRDVLRCFNATSRGICTNIRAIRRQEVEARVLRAMQERLLEPASFREFCAGFRDEIKRLRTEHLSQVADARREIVAIQRRREDILQAFGSGIRSEAWRDELPVLDERESQLRAALVEPAAPELDPNLAEAFQRKTRALAEGLSNSAQSGGAREALRSLLERIVIPPLDGLLQVVGNIGKMLTAAQGRSASNTAVVISGCGGRI